MAIKYVKDFEHPTDFGFSGSAGKKMVKPHMRGAAKKAAGPDLTQPVKPPKAPGMGRMGMAGKPKKGA